MLDHTELKQTVYIYKCTNSVIQVKGKVNSITLGKGRARCTGRQAGRQAGRQVVW